MSRIPLPFSPARPAAFAMGATEWSLLGLLSVLWGGSFFFVSVAVTALPPLTVVVARVGLAAVVLWAVVALLRMPVPWSRALAMAFLGMGLLNNVVPFTLFVWAQTRIPGGLASILNATTPLFGVVVAGLLLPDERMTPARLAGAVLGLGGVAVLVGPQVLGGTDGSLAAQAACLGAALSYACAGVFGRRFKAMGIPPLVVAAGQVGASTLVLLPLVAVVDRPWTVAPPGWPVAAAVVGLAVVSTAVAYIVYFRLLERAGASNSLLVTLLIPVSAILLGGLFLGERLEPATLAGMVLIAVGLAVLDGRPLRLLRRITP